MIRESLEATEFPQVENTVADITLLAHEQVMKVKRVEETFRMFNDSIFHGGEPGIKAYGSERIPGPWP